MKHQDIINQMTLEEKYYLFSGKDFWQTRSVERLGEEAASQGVGILLGRPIPDGTWSGTPDLNITFIYNMPFRGIAKMAGDAVWTWPGIPVELFGVPFTLAIIGNNLLSGGVAMVIIFAVDNKIFAPGFGENK